MSAWTGGKSQKLYLNSICVFVCASVIARKKEKKYPMN